MAAAGNPSILLTLWAPVIEITEIGRELIGLREAGEAVASERNSSPSMAST